MYVGDRHKPFSSSILLYSSFLSFSPATNLTLRFSCNSASCFTVETDVNGSKFTTRHFYKIFLVLVSK